MALLEQTGLDEAPGILVADLVRDGPRLCEAVVRALGDDGDLQRLELGGALERLASGAGELAGASQAETSALAVDALRAVIWSAACEQLGADPAEVEILSERLAIATELVRGAVLRRFGGAGEAAERVWPPLAVAEAVGEGVVDRDPVVRDIGEDEVGATRAGEGGAAQSPMAAGSLWRGALEDEVARAQRSGAKLALLLAELSDDDAAPAAGSAHVASGTFGRFAQAVHSAVRREDILACETERRAWVIARTTGRAGARALGARIARAVHEAEPGRGVPLTVGIGVAILGEDAHDAIGLIEAADDWAFAAVSAGAAPASSDAPPSEPVGDDEPPGEGGPEAVAE